ncbi:F-box protein GID2-like [Andrographis paniculata]|uniref:F-box protein GID2-like n=1 Tax=Andrographis paniculata TaxID=175694 RepID=UPI0021E85DE4|nr:F-box protein GID2-like [Andrographis paniculata]
MVRDQARQTYKPHFILPTRTVIYNYPNFILLFQPAAKSDPTISISISIPMSQPLRSDGDCSSNKKIRSGGGGDGGRDADRLSKLESALSDNLLFEILRHMDDGRSLGRAACVSRRWKRVAYDECLWEMICERNHRRSLAQLRPLALAVGGFRRLFSSHVSPPAAAPSSWPRAFCPWPRLPPFPLRSYKDAEDDYSVTSLCMKYYKIIGSKDRQIRD